MSHASHRHTPSPILLPPPLDIFNHRIRIRNIRVAPPHVAQVIPVRAFFVVADAVFGDDGAEAVGEAVDHRGADAAAGDAAGHDDRVDPLLGEERRHRGLEEDRRAALA